MRLFQISREAWASGISSLVPFLLIAAVGFAMCFSVVMTVGRTAASEAEVFASLRAEGSQVLTVVDTKDAGIITSEIVSVLQSASQVERAIGMSAPFDSTNAAIGPGGERIPTWVVLGDVDESAPLVRGRYPRAGEAMVAVGVLSKIGLDQPLGALADNLGRQYPIVGSFNALNSESELGAGAVVASDGTIAIASIRIEIDDYRNVAGVQDLALSLIHPTDPNSLQVDSPNSLAELQADILSGLGSSHRGLLVLVIGSGSLVIAAVCLSDTLIRRRELGRRRALGISRTDLIILVVLRSVLPASIGAVLGTIVGGIAAQAQGSLPPPTFLIGAAALATIACSIAAFAPAVAASFRDPVKILRTP